MRAETARFLATVTLLSGTIVTVLLLTAPSAATMEELLALLHRAEENARPAVPLRADGALVIRVPGVPPARYQIALLQRQNGDLYIELREPGVRTLILDGGERAYMLAAATSKPRPFAAEEPLVGSDFTREDLQPFVAQNYLSPQVADQSSHRITVSLTPRKSQYSLLVSTFDVESYYAVKTMHYVKTLNNLVKMRRDRDLVLVAGRWRSREIGMQHLQLRTESVLQLEWREAPDMPLDLFHPDSLTRPSALTWPAKATEEPRS